MEEHIVIIISISHATHDVLRIKTTKPTDYRFVAGQATEISINKSDWKNKKKPFTFTCLPEDDFLEFFIKTYPAHNGITNQLLAIKPNDELILNDVFGAIAYKEEGIFIAGGAGVTPFIAILRDLSAKGILTDNKLIFANKTKEDIILEEEFEKMLGKNFINILSDEDVKGYAHGFITEEFIKKNGGKEDSTFYVCGPPSMMEVIDKQLKDLGVQEQNIIRESF